MGIFDFFRKAGRAVLPERTVADISVQGLCDLPENSLRTMIHHTPLGQMDSLQHLLRQAKELEEARMTADKENKDLHVQNVIKLARAIREAMEHKTELLVAQAAKQKTA
jgi:hypothetical protein